MLYSYELNVLTSHTSGAPLIQDITLSYGILSRFRVSFPRGCSGLVKCQLFKGSTQIAPQNVGGSYALDGDIADTPLIVESDGLADEFTLKAWGVGCSYSHKLQVYIDVSSYDSPLGAL